MAAPARIAAHYLLSAPPGELAEVEKDVTTLAPAALSAAELARARGGFAVAHSSAFRVEGGGVVLAVKELRISGDDDSSALVVADAATRAAYLLNTETWTATRVDDSDSASASGGSIGEAVASLLPAAGEEVRAALARAFASHVEAAYNPRAAGSWPWAKGSTVFTMSEPGSDAASGAGAAASSGEFVLVGSAVTRNLTNFWSGALQSRYVVRVGASSWSVVGGLRMSAHYFESGNTQLHQERGTPGGAAGMSVAVKGDTAATAAAVVDVIARFETDTHIKLDEMFMMMSDTALKEIRRFLPVSGQKMNWNLAGHRVARSMASTAGGSSAAAGGKA